MNPLYPNKESVPEADLNAEKEIILTQIKNDEKNAKKPEAVLEKMVIGKIGKFYSEKCLLEQDMSRLRQESVADILQPKLRSSAARSLLRALSVMKRAKASKRDRMTLQLKLLNSPRNKQKSVLETRKGLKTGWFSVLFLCFCMQAPLNMFKVDLKDRMFQ